MGSFGKKTNNNSNPKKKKVPKGKRARAKAKLDRQWGEIQQQTTETSSFRRGKSRLLSKTSPNDNTHVAAEAAVVSKVEKGQHVTTPQQKWKQQQKQQFTHPIDDDDDDDESSSSSSVRSDDDEVSSDDIKNPLQELVTMIRNNKKMKKNKQSSSSLVSNFQRTDPRLRHSATMSSDSTSSNSNSHNNSEDDNDNEDDDDEESYRSSDSSHHDYNNNDDDPNEEKEQGVDEMGNDIPTTTTSNDRDDHMKNDFLLLFQRHFQRPPLSKDELSRLSPQKTTSDRTVTTTTTTKIPIQFTTNSNNDGTVELQAQTTTTTTKAAAALSDQRQGNVPDEMENEETKDMQQLLSLTTHQQWQREASAILTNHTNSLLQRQWNSIHGINTNKNKNKDFMDSIQAPIYSFLSRYCDTLVTTTSTPMTTTAASSSSLWKKTQKEQDQWHQMYLLHILNHVLTKQQIIKRNNQREGLSETKEVQQQQHSATTTTTNITDGDDDDSISMDTDMLRDQGFTRPAVLVLLPTRGTCHEFISTMVRLLGTELDPTVHERFQADYGELVDDDNDDDDNHNNTNSSKNATAEKEIRRKQVLKQKGREWNQLFGETANQDDDFKIGITISSNNNKKKKKQNKNHSNQNQPQSPISVRLYADFFKSDIIVASPLGLKMVLTNHDDDEDAADNNDDGKGRSSNIDFLSSIEICLLQHSDVMLMQNWDHVNDILDALNQPPQHNNNTDFSRVRQYLLEGQGEHWRQLILSTKFVDPTLISSFKRFGKSHAGSVKVRRKTPSDEASIASVLLPIAQVFHKVPVGSFAQQSPARVEYFVKHLLPQIQKHQQKHTLVFIPSYFDYCSLRNAFLKLESVSFVSVTEYSRTSEIGRGRARFLQGRKPILLYTGRAHYFHRHAIKGIKHLVFLGLPEHASFYAEYVNLIGTLGASSTNKKVMDDDDDDMDMTDHSATSCVVLFTKYEAHALERVVGSKNCSQMLSSSKRTFMFHS
ncbi:UTP25, U3 small nucleolar RNA-associated SSU processome protein 25 [Nitzschia inconspicua]|uniref:UTP25, U3 small nucleolar RNA-associated SSU processome protein 25 n=1 Tax=Nitzschia inconspicua TaxID=303405 RepID=A0A9K3K706_9STRA|nr:UTP25, U3 small nucleolar RNA-associated SSU processome protein 25 [Nitzschia inconspicua]KAG7373624.1 UTP25, U3 small nucleolar RNA-associated SSU processome protein 25 [Nitzschia inconspicua]